MKQYLNELNNINKLAKYITNNDSDKPIWLLQYNNVNIPNLLLDILQNGYLIHEWEGNEHSEKEILPVKNEFISKKGKFVVYIMQKLYSKKIMNYLTD